MDILEKIDTLLNEIEYNPRKTSHGRRKSKASRKTGAEKQKYIKALRDKRKEYKRSPAQKIAAKRAAKKYKKTSKHKQNKKRYKQINK